MNRMKRRWGRLAVSSIALVAAGSLALSGCAASGGSGTNNAGDKTENSAPATPKPDEIGGTLKVAIGSEPGGLDENAAFSVEAVNISESIFEKLFALDAKNDVHPMLVDTYKVSDDRLTYDFTLRDVTFSDGTPLTPDDAIQSIEYWERVNPTGAAVKADTATLEKTGDLSFELVLKSPRYTLLKELAGVGTGIIKGDLAKGLDQKGFKPTPDEAIGTGPYMLKSYQPNQQIVLVKNPDYTSRDDGFSSGYAGDKHAYFDELEFDIVPDPDALMSGMRTGKWDYTMGIPVDQYETFKNDPTFTTGVLSGGNLNILTLNTWKYSIFHDQKARDALNMAIDKNALNEATGGSEDITVRSGALVNKERTVLYSDAGKAEYEKYDPQKAKKLFKEAGYTDSKPIRILTSGSFPAFVQWATIIKAELKKIGIKVDVKQYDFATMLQTWQAHPDQWDIVPIFFNGDFPTPGQMNELQPNNVPATDTHPALPNTQPKAIQEALADYLLVTNDQEAHEQMVKITKAFWQNKGAIILSMTKPYAVYTPKLKGYDDYWYVFWNSWLEK